MTERSRQKNSLPRSKGLQEPKEAEQEDEDQEEEAGDQFAFEETKGDKTLRDSYGIEIFTTNYLGKATRKVELLSRIKVLHDSLKHLDEVGTMKKTLAAISGQLNSKKLIGNQEKEIRLLSAACILDILRLFAPDVPYSSEELCEFFESVTVMLRGFSTYDPNTPMGSSLFYILTSLSTVRSCAILVFLSQQNIPHAHERLKEFLEALMSSIRPDHSEAVTGHIGNILEVCLVEMTEKIIDQELLDILLSPLLPHAKHENPAAYHLSQSVLSRCVSKLQPAMSAFINHTLVGGLEDVSPSSSAHHRSTPAQGSEESNLSEEIYTVLYEVSKISSAYLLHTLPNICIQLQAEESDKRLEVVKLLGRLFSSPHSHYGRDFSKNFRDYLGRFVDISTNIRLEMIESGYLTFVHHTELREPLEGLSSPPP
jgi:sister chromatid cohesion protein PDS5